MKILKVMLFACSVLHTAYLLPSDLPGMIPESDPKPEKKIKRPVIIEQTVNFEPEALAKWQEAPNELVPNQENVILLPSIRAPRLKIKPSLVDKKLEFERQRPQKRGIFVSNELGRIEYERQELERRELSRQADKKVEFEKCDCSRKYFNKYQFNQKWKNNKQKREKCWQELEQENEKRQIEYERMLKDYNFCCCTIQ